MVQTDHEDETQMTHKSNEETHKAGLSTQLTDLKTQLDKVCKNPDDDKTTTVDEQQQQQQAVVPPTMPIRQMASETSSVADDEMEHGSYHSTDTTRMLTELCGEMKNCLRQVVEIMQVHPIFICNVTRHFHKIAFFEIAFPTRFRNHWSAYFELTNHNLIRRSHYTQNILIGYSNYANPRISNPVPKSGVESSPVCIPKFDIELYINFIAN